MKSSRILSCVTAVVLGWGMGMFSNAAWSAPDINVQYFATSAYGGALDPTVSADGRYVAYRDQSNSSIFILDVRTGARTQANRMLTGELPTKPACDMPAMSADARYVVFGCTAAAMGGKPYFGTDAYFVYDRINDRTEMLQVPDSKTAVRSIPPAISADGRYIAFRAFTTSSDYTLYVRDTVNKTTLITNAQGVYGGTPMSMSDDGRYVAYSGRTVISNSLNDVFVYDVATGVTETINVSSSGVRGTKGADSATMSGDGNFVAFSSGDTALVASKATGIFLRDRRAGTTELINDSATAAALYQSMSGNGRYLAFVVPLLRSLYVYDRLTKTKRVIPGAYTSTQSALYSAFSADGRYLAFQARSMVAPLIDYIGVADLGVAAGVALSTNSLTLTEGGIAGTYTAVLTQAPTADVKVTLGAGAQLSLARTVLTFTPSNWSTPQVVSVQAVADGVTEGTHSATIVHTVSSADADYSVVQPANVTVTISDGIVPTIVIPGATWTQAEMPLTGTAAPGSTVLLTAANRSTGWLSAVSTVADAKGNWSYMLTGYTDGVIDLDAQADGVKSVVRTVTVTLRLAPPAPTYVDVTGYIRTTGLSLAYNRSTGKYVGNFMLTNTGSIPLAGPLHVQFDGLTAGVTLDNATASHDGAPYITVPAGLEPDASVTIPLVFDNPGRVGIGYNAKIYSGTF